MLLGAVASLFSSIIVSVLNATILSIHICEPCQHDGTQAMGCPTHSSMEGKDEDTKLGLVTKQSHWCCERSIDSKLKNLDPTPHDRDEEFRLSILK